MHWFSAAHSVHRASLLTQVLFVDDAFGNVAFDSNSESSKGMRESYVALSSDVTAVGAKEGTVDVKLDKDPVVELFEGAEVKSAGERISEFVGDAVVGESVTHNPQALVQYNSMYAGFI